MSKAEPLREISAGQRLIASSSGAVVTALFMTPLDVVKVRLQSQQKTLLRSPGFSTCSQLLVDCIEGCVCPSSCTAAAAGSTRQFHRHAQLQVPFKGTSDALLRIARYEGIGALWSGLPPTLVMAVPATVIYFSTYDSVKGAFLRNKTFDTTVGVAVSSGATARVVTATCISPLELCRTKLQSQVMSYGQLAQAVRDMVAARGIRSLYLGLSSTLLRDVPFSCIYWAMYESLKRRFVHAGQNPSLHFCLSAGAISGAAAAIVTLPFDVVKTYRQIELGEQMSRPQSTGVKLPGPFAMLGNIYNKQGARGLFAGLVPRIAKTAPACAIMISTYEMFKNFFLSKATTQHHTWQQATTQTSHECH